MSVHSLINNSEFVLTKNHQAILSAICYSDVFNFPLTKSEIHANSKFEGTDETLEIAIQQLIELNHIKFANGFYILSTANLPIIEQRKKREAYFANSYETVKKYSHFISKFPFVQGVYLSGSYSKSQMSEGDDIDYFIITKSNRLWLCRSMLRGYKKFFVRKSTRYFCMNYFLDEQHLEVPDKNIFVANEVKTLVPAYNFDLYKQFQAANEWTNSFLPNKPLYDKSLLQDKQHFPVKRFFELVLNGKLGDWLEKKLFVFMEKRRKRKFQSFTKEEFDLNMRTQKNAEKHHPAGTQGRVLQGYKERMAQFEIS